MDANDDLDDEDMDMLVKLVEEAEASDRWWELADWLDEKCRVEGAAPPGRPGGAADGRDGSYAVLDRCAQTLREATKYDYKFKRLRNLRATARAWPPEERDNELSFGVHLLAQSPKAKAKLAGYKRRAAKDGVRLTERRVKVYRADDAAASRPVVSWADKYRKRAQAYFKGVANDGPQTRQTIEEALSFIEEAYREALKAVDDGS